MTFTVESCCCIAQCQLSCLKVIDIRPLLIDVFYNEALMHWMWAGSELKALKSAGAVKEIAADGAQGGLHKK